MKSGISPITPHDHAIGTPPDNAVPDWLAAELHNIERDFRGMLSDEIVWSIDGDPMVSWSIAVKADGRDQREAIALELVWLAGLLRKAG